MFSFPQKVMQLVLLIGCFLTACDSAMTPTHLPVVVKNVSGVTPITAIDTATPSPTKQVPISTKETLHYETIYTNGNLQIREAFLGSLDTWQWSDFSMPAARITEEVGTYGPSTDYDSKRCDKDIKANGWCVITIKRAGVNGLPSEFDLVTSDMAMTGGHYRLRKNGQFIWEGDLFGGTWLAIHRITWIGDELAIEAVVVEPDSQKKFESILLTKGNTVINVQQTTQYDEVFYPFDFDGQLAYFAKTYQPQLKTVLVVGGRAVGQEYDSVFNQYCCWDGPPVQIINNLEIVDFFAERNGGWYHVQAGNLASLK